MTSSATGQELLLQPPPGPERPPVDPHPPRSTSATNLCCCLPAVYGTPRPQPIIALDEFDQSYESACMTLADCEVRLTRARARSEDLEKQAMKNPSSAVELTADLARWRREVDDIIRQREEAETQKRLCRLQRSRTQCEAERLDYQRHLVIFSTVARWQHLSTYLLYLTLIMNVVITTFGISGGTYEGQGAEERGMRGSELAVAAMHRNISRLA